MGTHTHINKYTHRNTYSHTTVGIHLPLHWAGKSAPLTGKNYKHATRLWEWAPDPKKKKNLQQKCLGPVNFLVLCFNSWCSAGRIGWEKELGKHTRGKKGLWTAVLLESETVAVVYTVTTNDFIDLSLCKSWFDKLWPINHVSVILRALTDHLSALLLWLNELPQSHQSRQQSVLVINKMSVLSSHTYSNTGSLVCSFSFCLTSV